MGLARPYIRSRESSFVFCVFFDMARRKFTNFLRDISKKTPQKHTHKRALSKNTRGSGSGTGPENLCVCKYEVFLYPVG